MHDEMSTLFCEVRDSDEGNIGHETFDRRTYAVMYGDPGANRRPKLSVIRRPRFWAAIIILVLAASVLAQFL